MKKIRKKKDAKAEPAWYEKRADGTAWFETDFDLEGELSRGGDKTGEENAREKALPKEEERAFDFSKEEADGETEALNETFFPFSEKETTLPEESAFSKEKTENKEKPSDEGEGGDGPARFPRLGRTRKNLSARPASAL